MGALAEARCQKTSSVAGARVIARPRARAADDLSAQGSGLCARQAKGSSHALVVVPGNVSSKTICAEFYLQYNLAKHFFHWSSGSFENAGKRGEASGKDVDIMSASSDA